MAIDIDISNWILEFIIQQPVNDTVLNSLFQILPLPNNNLNLKKALILRKIESEVSKGSVSDKVLEFIELFEELDYRMGIDSLVEMRVAYCAVAVECTMKFLKKKLAGNDHGAYFGAVRRIWKQRVNLMEKWEDSVGVVSEELWRWRDEIEASVWDDRLCEKVMRRSEDVFVVAAVRGFVRKAKERIGSPFLSVVAESYRNDDATRAFPGGVNEEQTCRNSDGEARKGNASLRQKHVAFRRTRGASVRTCGGIRISDSAELGLEASSEQDKLLPSPQIEEAMEALKLSTLELRAVVKDPLPDALKLAETVSSEVRNNVDHQPAKNNSDEAPHPVGVNSRMVQANEETCDAQRNCHHNAASKPNLMNQKSAAHTSERDDSTDDSNEGSPTGTKRFTLPSPKKTNISPLKKYEFKKITTRRITTKWSKLEEDTLRAGVQKHGVGNWKRILESYPDIFSVRTGVDLKDKWRNLL